MAKFLESLGLGRGSDASTATKVDPKVAAKYKVTIKSTVPPVAAPASLLHLPCRIENRSNTTFASVPPTPVHLSYRWFDGASNAQLVDNEIRTALVRPIAAGATLEQPMNVRAPSRPGKYLLRVTLVQEHVCWFDDIEDSNSCDLRIEIAAPQKR